MCVFSFLYLFCDHFVLPEATAFRVKPEYSQYSQTLFGEQASFCSCCSKRLAMLSCFCIIISFSSTDSSLLNHLPVDSHQFNLPLSSEQLVSSCQHSSWYHRCKKDYSCRSLTTKTGLHYCIYRHTRSYIFAGKKKKAIHLCKIYNQTLTSLYI